MNLNKDIDNTLTYIKNHLNKVNLFGSGLIPDLFFTRDHVEYDVTFDKIESLNGYNFDESFCVLKYEYMKNDYFLAEINKSYCYVNTGNKTVKKLSNKKIEVENDCLLVVAFLKMYIASYDIIK